MGWRKRRQRKWKKNKEKVRWTKKVGSGNEAQRGTQMRRYEGEKTKTAKLERSGFKKKKNNFEEFWDHVRQFEIVGLVETWVEERSWEEIEKL
jgi:hypothetical protein